MSKRFPKRDLVQHNEIRSVKILHRPPVIRPIPVCLTKNPDRFGKQMHRKPSRQRNRNLATDIPAVVSQMDVHRVILPTNLINLAFQYGITTHRPNHIRFRPESSRKLNYFPSTHRKCPHGIVRSQQIVDLSVGFQRCPWRAAVQNSRNPLLDLRAGRPRLKRSSQQPANNQDEPNPSSDIV